MRDAEIPEPFMALVEASVNVGYLIVAQTTKQRHDAQVFFDALAAVRAAPAHAVLDASALRKYGPLYCCATCPCEYNAKDPWDLAWAPPGVPCCQTCWEERDAKEFPGEWADLPPLPLAAPAPSADGAEAMREACIAVMVRRLGLVPGIAPSWDAILDEIRALPLPTPTPADEPATPSEYDQARERRWFKAWSPFKNGSRHCETAWRAWQARASIPTPQPDAVAEAREALIRLAAWAGWTGALDAGVSLGVKEWVRGGMVGPLPPLPEYAEVKSRVDKTRDTIRGRALLAAEQAEEGGAS